MYEEVYDGNELMVMVPAYGTKVCPQCGEGVFDDMDVCYGCLHEFSSEADVGTVEDGDLVPTEAYVAAMPEQGVPPTPPCLVRISSPSMDVTVPLPPDGLLMGRGSSCDVVLHARSVSRRHVRLEPGEGGVLATDQGAANPARLNGRPLGGSVTLGDGDRLDVCGVTVTILRRDEPCEGIGVS